MSGLMWSDVVWWAVGGTLLAGVVVLALAVSSVLRRLPALRRAALRLLQQHATAVALGERAQAVQVRADAVAARAAETSAAAAWIATKVRNSR